MKTQIKDAILSQYGKPVYNHIEIAGQVIFGWHIEDEEGNIMNRTDFSEQELLNFYNEVSDVA